MDKELRVAFKAAVEAILRVEDFGEVAVVTAPRTLLFSVVEMLKGQCEVSVKRDLSEFEEELPGVLKESGIEIQNGPFLKELKRRREKGKRGGCLTGEMKREAYGIGLRDQRLND